MRNRALGRIALALALAGAPLALAHAKPLMIVGNDEKVIWDDAGNLVASPPGKDTLSVIDLAKPGAPKIIATIPLENSLVGPPTNLAIHPSGNFAVVADSVTTTEDAGKWKVTPTNKIFVIDLTVNPPAVIDTVVGAMQPSGLDISAKGDLMVVGNRAGKSVSLFSIKGTKIELIDTLAFPDSVAHAGFTPDGRYVLAVRNVANMVSVINVIDNKLVYNNVDLPTGVAPYNVVVTPDGKLAMTADQGGSVPDGTADTVTVIDLASIPAKVIERIAVTDFPEGLALNAKGDLAAVGILRGGISAKTAPYYHKTGTVQILKVNGQKVTKLKEIEVGGIPEPVVFSPDGKYIYVGNLADKNVSILKVDGDKVTDTGKRLALPGHPASARVGPR